jgi:eukaryotic-like serine/threonine-protein kinase
LLPCEGRQHVAHTRFLLVDFPGSWRGLTFSPDGHWVAYTSDKSGRYEVYVRPFPGPGAPAIVSTAGGQAPYWALDGSKLYFQQSGGLWAASVRTRPTLRIGKPELLFEGPYAPDYDVDPEGRGVVMVRLDPPAEQSRFNVVLNWFTELDGLLQGQR